MKLLIVGNGAREHALAWKLAQSQKVDHIFITPGNAGTAELGQNLSIEVTDVAGLLQAVTEHQIDLVVIGPEGPLAVGLVDELESRAIPVFGPIQKAAQLESSKVFAKNLLHRYGIPTAKSRVFSDFTDASAYLAQQNLPIVIKADGLAAGKGVYVCSTTGEAQEALFDVMQKRLFGDSGNRVVIEEYLHGSEMSFLIFTDGISFSAMPPVCDYKRVNDGDCGPNTGGMGAYTPPVFLSPSLIQIVEATIVEPMLRALRKESINYRGVLYIGLMITDSGPKVLEFNARFGDPETQVVLPLLKTDLVDVMLRVIDGSLASMTVDWAVEACVGVVMASGGYPQQYSKDLPVSGLNDMGNDVLLFQAGTQLVDGQVRTNGGRVLTVVATGNTLNEARHKAYANIEKITFADAHFRKDIALFGTPSNYPGEILCQK